MTGPSSIDEPGLAFVPSWQPLRGPMERWPGLTDLALAILALLLTLMLWSTGPGESVFELVSFADVGAILVAFAGSMSLLWRRSHPWQAHAVVMVAILLVYTSTPAEGLVAMAFSLFSLGRYEASRQASVLGAVAAAAFVLFHRAVMEPLTPGGTMTVFAVLAVWYWGRRLRFRGEYLRLLEERAHHLEREQHAEAERAVTVERSRIAREMHDVVAHQLSLMTVQAGAARTIAGKNPEAATEAMAAVEQAGRRALAEMRQLLSVLRPNAQQVELAPQPGVKDIPALCEQVAEVGPRVTLEIDETIDRLAPRLDLTVYRLVQEALTNVIKHAGKNVSVSVKLLAQPSGYQVTVLDTGHGPRASKQSGHGLIGMRERVEILGGQLTAGASEQGGFEVNATLPYPADRQSESGHA